MRCSSNDIIHDHRPSTPMYIKMEVVDYDLTHAANDLCLSLSLLFWVNKGKAKDLRWAIRVQRTGAFPILNEIPFWILWAKSSIITRKP